MSLLRVIPAGTAVEPPPGDRLFSRLHKMTSEHAIAIAFALCASGVLGFGFFAMSLLGRAERADAQVLHTALAISRLEALHLVLVETESAGRAFLIAGSQRSRSRYASLLPRIDEQLRAFKQFTTDNTDQQKVIPELEQNIARRFAYLDALVELRVAKGPEAVVRSTGVGTGVQEMQSIATHVNHMKEIAISSHEVSRAAQQRQDGRLELALAVLITITVGIMAAMFWQMRRLWLARLRAEAAALQEAHHDSLTGLPNRRLLQDRLRVALAGASRYKHVLAVLCLDLNGFKAVNDDYGHDAGDELLRAVSERLAKLMRCGDTAARVGGDEFVVVLSSLPEVDYSEVVAARIARSIAAPYVIQGRTVSISTSIGIALYPQNGESSVDLLKAADEALYREKKVGKAHDETSQPSRAKILELVCTKAR